MEATIWRRVSFVVISSVLSNVGSDISLTG